MGSCRFIVVVAMAIFAAQAACSSTLPRVVSLDDYQAHHTAVRALFYALPLTVIDVVIPVKRVDVAPAACAFAGMAAELGLDGSLVTGGTSFAITEGVVLAAHAEADPERVYAVLFEDEALADQTTTLALTEDGRLTSASYSVKDRTAATVGGVLTTLTDVAVKAAFRGDEQHRVACDAKRKRVLDYRAALAALPADRRVAAPAVVAELYRSQIADDLSHFRGTRSERTSRVTCRHTPSRSTAGTAITLFTLDASTGVSGVHAACTVPAGLRTNGGAATPTAVSLTVTAATTSLATRIDSLPAATGRRSYAWAVPRPATAILSNGDPLATLPVLLPQLGPVVSLGGDEIAASEVQLDMSLHEGVGSLQKLTLARRAVDASLVESAGNAVGTVLDSGDELARLEREQKRLEARVAIEKATKELRALEQDEDAEPEAP